MPPILEVCVDCVESAINAVKGGASRLELCSALDQGGLTPTPGLLKVVSAAVDVPIFCLIRPRRGHFIYSREEIDVMKSDILLLRAVGRVEGFVIGALNLKGELNAEVCKELLQTVGPLPTTLHRAIDVCVNPLEAVDTAIELGFKRILTSGCKPSAESGTDMIRAMIARANGRIVIMPGSGIAPQNAGKIRAETGVTEIHASARQHKPPPRTSTNTCTMGSGDAMEGLMITDEKTVAEILRSASNR